MIIDPRERARRRSRQHSPDRRAPLVVVVGLAIECAALLDLAEWRPCGALLDEIPAVVTGEGSLTVREVNRLRTWAANWRALSPRLRTFYTLHHEVPGVDAGLWYVLGTGDRPSGPAIGRLRRAYEDVTGFEPGIDLLPQPATRERTTT